MSDTSDSSSVIQPALDALNRLRNEISKRIGMSGGNLNQRLLSDLATLEVVIRQFAVMKDNVNLLNHQAQQAAFGFQVVRRQLESMQKQRAALPNGDDDLDTESETKGQ